MSVKESVLRSLRNLKNPDQSATIVTTRNEWIKAIDALFDQFMTWLADPIKEKLLAVHFGTSHFEDRLGTYSTRTMMIHAPSGAEIAITPRDRFAVGTKGRVDFECIPKSEILVRNQAGEWQFAYLDPPRGWRLEALTEESFWDELARLFGMEKW